MNENQRPHEPLRTLFTQNRTEEIGDDVYGSERGATRIHRQRRPGTNMARRRNGKAPVRIGSPSVALGLVFSERGGAAMRRLPVVGSKIVGHTELFHGQDMKNDGCVPRLRW
jgi:hypothetical protein